MGKFVHRNCSNGQSVFDVLDELKRDGTVPASASVGNQYSWNDEKNDKRIIGAITVRRDEMYSIVAA